VELTSVFLNGVSAGIACIWSVFGMFSVSLRVGDERFSGNWGCGHDRVIKRILSGCPMCSEYLC